MPDEKKEEHPVDAYLRATGRQETAPMTFGDLKAVLQHAADAPPEEEKKDEPEAPAA